MFKLVRIDTEDPNEIQLPVGTYLIGRDKLIGFDDRRLSYNHGLIIVKENSVTIESSQRKIYLTKKGSKDKELLNKTFKTTLENGDQFGFVENAFWYELKCSEPSRRAMQEINGNSLNTPHFAKESVVPNSPLEDDENPMKRTRELRKAVRRLKKRKEDSEEEAGAGHSDSELEQSYVSGIEDYGKPVSPGAERKRCKYGADCYSLRTLRSNPMHKAHTVAYSHPRDDDWAGDRKLCPQGAACRRRGRHPTRFRHPPGYKAPPPVTSESESESDSDIGEYRSDFMLRTKRERKTLPKEALEDLEDSGSEEEDPFESDGSEDWVPEP